MVFLLVNRKEMNNVELANALEEGRLLLAQRYLREKQHEQAIEALQALKCPEASFQQGQVSAIVLFYYIFKISEPTN